METCLRAKQQFPTVFPEAPCKGTLKVTVTLGREGHWNLYLRQSKRTALPSTLLRSSRWCMVWHQSAFGRWHTILLSCTASHIHFRRKNAWQAKTGSQHSWEGRGICLWEHQSRQAWHGWQALIVSKWVVFSSILGTPMIGISFVQKRFSIWTRVASPLCRPRPKRLLQKKDQSKSGLSPVLRRVKQQQSSVPSMPLGRTFLQRSSSNGSSWMHSWWNKLQLEQQGTPVTLVGSMKTFLLDG